MQDSKQSKSLALRIALGYLLVGTLYILFSDQIVSGMMINSDAVSSITFLQTIKGWLFITVTATILYFLIHRHFKAIHRSRHELQLQKDRYLSLFQNAPVPIWVVDFSNLKKYLTSFESEGRSIRDAKWASESEKLRAMIHQARVTDVNFATLRLFESDDRDQLDREIAATLTDESCAVVFTILTELGTGSQRSVWEMPIRSLSGRELTVLLSIAIPPGNQETWGEVHLMMLDITDQKRAADLLERNRMQLVEAQRIGQSGSWEWNFATNKLILSEQLIKISGKDLTSNETTIETFLDTVHPDDRQAVRDRLNAQGEYATFRDAPYRIIRPDGEVRYILSRGEKIRDKSGHAIGMIGLAHDVTDRRREEEERRQLEAQLRQAQKLESLGALAGGIAHDFNNILTPLYGYTELVMQDLDEKSQTYEDLSHVMKAAVRGKELVQQILAFSRQIEQERKPLLLHHIVNEVIKLLRASVSPTIEIVKESDAEVDAVVADPVQMHQVIMNLCVNACHAMRETGGRLTLKIDSQEISEQSAVSVSDPKAGHYVRLRVIDTGTGMDETTRQRVFEPFFTTKPAGEGTGLGLSVSRQIVVGHKGNISVESRMGEGTVFTVLLPLAKLEPEISEQTRSGPARGHGRILFVDDESEIADLANQMLRRLGYHVETALDCNAAKAKIENQPAFDVLITDHVLPEQSGLQLAIELRSQGYQAPIILLTGDGIGLSDEVIRRSGINAFLSKPFSAFELSQSIQRVLAKKLDTVSQVS